MKSFCNFPSFLCASLPPLDLTSCLTPPTLRQTLLFICLYLCIRKVSGIESDWRSSLTSCLEKSSEIIQGLFKKKVLIDLLENFIMAGVVCIEIIWRAGVSVMVKVSYSLGEVRSFFVPCFKLYTSWLILFLLFNKQ